MYVCPRTVLTHIKIFLWVRRSFLLTRYFFFMSCFKLSYDFSADIFLSRVWKCVEIKCSHFIKKTKQQQHWTYEFLLHFLKKSCTRLQYDCNMLTYVINMDRPIEG